VNPGTHGSIKEMTDKATGGIVYSSASLSPLGHLESNCGLAQSWIGKGLQTHRWRCSLIGHNTCGIETLGRKNAQATRRPGTISATWPYSFLCCLRRAEAELQAKGSERVEACNSSADQDHKSERVPSGSRIDRGTACYRYQPLSTPPQCPVCILPRSTPKSP